MKMLRGAVTSAVLLLVGLLGATAAFGAGNLTVDPASDCTSSDPEVICIYFGESDDPVSETITLTNDHPSEPVDVTGIALATYPGDAPGETDNFGFVVLGETVPFEIDPLGSVEVEVTWTPSGERRDRAILRITHDAGDPIDVDLGGGRPFVLLPAERDIELGNVNIGQPQALGNQVGFNSHDWIRLRHSGPAFPNVTVNGCPNKTGPDADLFTVRCLHFNQEDPVLTTIDTTIIYRTGFHPDTTGEKSAVIHFSVETENLEVNVSGAGVTGAALYRVNSGGAIVPVDAASQSFTRDQAGNRSAYFLEGDGTALANNAVIDINDSSIPAATPLSIFASARTGGNAGTPIRYGFPVDPHVYTVRLFFVEADMNITGSGQRVFDVTINDSLALPGVDVFNVAGGRDQAFARAFLVDASDAISIDVERQTGTPPVLSGVEIVTGGSVELDAPDDVDFGSVTVGNTDSDMLTITNDAGPLGAAVRIDDVDLSGAGANDYGVSGLPAWVAPGADLELEIEFTPSESGARLATAAIEVHGGANLVVNLTGTGLAAPDPEPEPDPDPEPEPDPDPEPEPDPVSFVDIAGSTFTQDILWLAKVGITRGCNPPVNDRFCPDDFVTRGQMAAFFVRALNLTDRLDDPFVDDDGNTFEADIEKLAAAGITRGCNPPVNDRFCPNESVTRGQMAAFFHRAADLLGLPR